MLNAQLLLRIIDFTMKQEKKQERSFLEKKRMPEIQKIVRIFSELLVEIEDPLK